MSDTRVVPTNDLDMQMLMTEPGWQDIKTELKEKLSRYIGQVEKEKKMVDVYEDLSSSLALYTRDIRLGNLSGFNGEYEYVIYYLELAVDFLQAGYPTACVCSMNKALSRLEPSSSKGGFLRKLIQTIRQENYSNSQEPEKKKLMGGKKQ